MESPGQSTKIHVIEAMRGMASISVALFHFSGTLESDVSRAIASVGWLGVDVFFIISGFVIPYSIAGRGYSITDFPRFLARRLVRLDPPYLASILLGILLSYLSALVPGFRGTAPDWSLLQVAFHFLYLIPLTSYGWLSPVYWSLAYEFVFYILVGLLFSSLIVRDVGWTVAAAAVLVLARMLLIGATDVLIIEFLLGILAMRAVSRTDERYQAVGWILVSLAVVFGAAGLMHGLTCLASVAAILFLRATTLGPWAISIGALSYSLYLTHTLIGGRIVNLGKRLSSGTLYELALVLVALAASMAFAMLFSAVVEKPAIRMSRKIRF